MKWGVPMHGFPRLRCTCAASSGASASSSRARASSHRAQSQAASTPRYWTAWSRSLIRAVRRCSARASRSIGTRPSEDRIVVTKVGRLVLVLVTVLIGCHRPTEVGGMYLNYGGKGTLFPFDNSRLVVDQLSSGLTARQHALPHMHYPVRMS